MGFKFKCWMASLDEGISHSFNCTFFVVRSSPLSGVCDGPHCLWLIYYYKHVPVIQYFVMCIMKTKKGLDEMKKQISVLTHEIVHSTCTHVFVFMSLLVASARFKLYAI